jgi:hypothetical protein
MNMCGSCFYTYRNAADLPINKKGNAPRLLQEVHTYLETKQKVLIIINTAAV